MKKLRGYLMGLAVLLVTAAIIWLLLAHGNTLLETVRTHIQNGIEAASEHIEDAGLGPLRKGYIKQDEKTHRIEEKIDEKY